MIALERVSSSPPSICLAVAHPGVRRVCASVAVWRHDSKSMVTQRVGCGVMPMAERSRRKHAALHLQGCQYHTIV